MAIGFLFIADSLSALPLATGAIGLGADFLSAAAPVAGSAAFLFICGESLSETVSAIAAAILLCEFDAPWDGLLFAAEPLSAAVPELAAAGLFLSAARSGSATLGSVVSNFVARGRFTTKRAIEDSLSDESPMFHKPNTAG
jgi:hypothetical protein